MIPATIHETLRVCAICEQRRCDDNACVLKKKTFEPSASSFHITQHTQTNFNVQRWNLSGIFSILLSFEYFILISAQHASSQQHSHEVISQAKTFLSKIRTKQKKNALKTTLIQFRLLSIWLAHPAPCRHHHHRFLASKRNARFAARHIEGIDSGHMYSNFSTNIIFGIFKMESLCRLFIVRLRHRVSFK